MMVIETVVYDGGGTSSCYIQTASYGKSQNCNVLTQKIVSHKVAQRHRPIAIRIINNLQTAYHRLLTEL